MLPALIRKIHLGKALENNDWETIREDLNKFTMEGINGTADKKDIINVLSKYGIKQLLTSNLSLFIQKTYAWFLENQAQFKEVKM